MSDMNGGHLSEAHLIAVRDGSLPAGAAERLHVDGCPVCRAELDRLRRRSGVVTGALESLDVPWDLAAARARLRQTVTETTAEAAGVRPIPLARPRSWRPRRAAAVLVLLAATASALPGSPVRQWLASRGNDSPVVPETESRSVTVESLDRLDAGADERAGVRLQASPSMRISVRGLETGDEVRVVWTDGDEVAVLAPPGSRFTSGEDGVDAVVAGDPVTVEIPRARNATTLVVGGSVFLRASADAIDVSGPVTERTDSTVVFHVR